MAREVLVAGRGLAAHSFAAEFAARNPDAKIHLIGHEPQQHGSWFVLKDRLPTEIQRAVEDGEIGSHRLKRIRFVIFDGDKVLSDITAPGEDDVLPNDALLMINDRDTKAFLRNKAVSSPSVQIHKEAIQNAQTSADGIDITTQDGNVFSGEIAVDASGPRSLLQRGHDPALLTDDPWVLWIHGYRVTGEFDPDTMLFPLKDTTTGRISWITPWSEEVADVLASDYCRLSEYENKRAEFEQTYMALADLSQNNNICVINERHELITGKIRVVPIKRPDHASQIFAVGEAAGQACPNMAEAAPTAINQAAKLADMLSLNPDLTPQEYYDSWRTGEHAEYPYAVELAFLVNRLRYEQAGKNRLLYEGLADQGSPGDQYRLMRERKLELRDLPLYLRIAIHQPRVLEIYARQAAAIAALKLAPRLFDDMLYGEEQNR